MLGLGRQILAPRPFALCTAVLVLASLTAPTPAPQRVEGLLYQTTAPAAEIPAPITAEDVLIFILLFAIAAIGSCFLAAATLPQRAFRRGLWAAHAAVVIIALSLTLLDAEDTWLLSGGLVGALFCFDTSIRIRARYHARRKKTFDMIIAWFIAALGSIGVIVMLAMWLNQVVGGS